MKAGSYKAIVEKIILVGPHGPYAIARANELSGSVTFSLEMPQWKERSRPEPGTYVVLSDLQKKRAGWRANRARFLKPGDEKPAIQASRKEH